MKVLVLYKDKKVLQKIHCSDNMTARKLVLTAVIALALPNLLACLFCVCVYKTLIYCINIQIKIYVDEVL
jgi:hypothetical protein